jgi:hypothetical protein
MKTQIECNNFYPATFFLRKLKTKRPMKKFFTQSTISEEQNSEMKKEPKPAFGPRKETIRLLYQFARVYRFEPALSQGLCSFVIN